MLNHREDCPVLVMAGRGLGIDEDEVCTCPDNPNRKDTDPAPPPAMCPSCASVAIRYVQRVVEFHSMCSMPEVDEHGQHGYVELNALEEAVVDESFTPYLYCEDCHKEFKLDGSPKDDDDLPVPSAGVNRC